MTKYALASVFTVLLLVSSSTMAHAKPVSPPGSFALKTLAAYTNSSSVLIKWSAASGATSYDLSLDSNSPTCSAPIEQFNVATTQQQTGTLPDGTYFICSNAHNSAVQTTAASNSGMQFVVYTQPPTISAGDSLTTAAPFTPNATATSAIPILTQVWSKVSGPGSVTFDPSKSDLNPLISASTNGTYVIQLTVKDVAGNASVKTLQFVWYVTPPPTAFNIKPQPHYSNKNSPAIAWDSSTNATTYSIVVDSTSAQCLHPFQSASALIATTFDTSALSDGTYFICVTATGPTQETRAASNSGLSFTIYTQPPTVFAGVTVNATQSFTPNPSASSAVSLPLTYKWTKVSGPGNITFDPSRSDFNPDISCSKDGVYVAQLLVTDSVGNSASSILNFTWNTAPGLFIIKPVPAITKQTSPVISWTAATNGQHYSLAVDATDAQCQNPMFTVSGITATQAHTGTLPDGSYFACVTAVSSTGSTSVASNSGVPFSVYTVKPMVSAGTGTTTSQAFTPNARASSALALTSQWTQTSGPGAVTFVPADAVNPLITANASGTYTVKLKATDPAGNAASSSLRFVWTGVTPTCTLSGTSQGEIGTTATFNLSVTNSPTAVAFNNGALNSGLPTQAVTAVLGPNVGSETLTASVSNSTGSSTCSDTIQVLPHPNGIGTPYVFSSWSVAQGLDITSGNWQPGVGDSTGEVFTAPATNSVLVSFAPGLSIYGQPSFTAQGVLYRVNTFSPPSLTLIATSTNKFTATDYGAYGAPTQNTFNFNDIALTPGQQYYVALQIVSESNINQSNRLVPPFLTGQSTSRTVFSQSYNGNWENGNDVTSLYSIALSNAPAAPPLSVTQIPAVVTNIPYPITGAASGGTGQLTYAWQQISGNGELSFAPTSGAQTTISGSKDGTYTVSLTVSDQAGDSISTSFAFTWATTAPVLQLIPDQYASMPITLNAIAISSIPVTVSWTQLSGPVGGDLTFLDGAGSVTTSVSASGNGSYLVQLTATDAAFNTTSETFHLVWDSTVPIATITSAQSTLTVGTAAQFAISFSDAVTGFSTNGISLSQGTVGSLTGSGTLYTLTATPFASGSLIISVLNSAAQNIVGTEVVQSSLTIPVASASSGGTGASGGNGSGTSPGVNPTSPVPAPSGNIVYTSGDFESCLAANLSNTNAPSLNAFVNFYQSTNFIFTGSNPSQVGMTQPPAANLIAVLRGRVKQINGTPIVGASVAVLNHPELGTTKSGSCGEYILALDGGIGYTLSVSTPGYISAQRHVIGRVQNYLWLDDVILVQPDVNTYQAPSSTVATVVVSGLVNDNNGQRQATMFVPAGTGIISADGQTKVNSPSYRVTDLSIGSEQAAEAPGSLPLGTYSGFMADVSTLEIPEAQTGNFSQPTILYVANYLYLHGGTELPTYSYDPVRQIWTGDTPALVINVLNVFQGTVSLDMTGNGIAATPAQLATIGINNAELAVIAATPSIYNSGNSSFIRMVRTHSGTVLVPEVRVQ